MKKNNYFLIALIAAVASGCNTMPQNSSLAEAHNSYNLARSSEQVTNLAAVELKDAEDSLNKADRALSNGENDNTVNQLAYIAKQKIAMAQETAKRRTAEQDVANASATRDKVRLEARTAEADAAKQQAAIAQQTAEQQAAALAAASSEAERNQIRHEATVAEAEAAKKQAASAQESAQLQAAEAKSNSDRELAEAKTNSARELAEAKAAAEHDRATIAEQEAQMKELNAKKTERGLVITLGDVLFSSGKTELKSRGKSSMQKLADFLKQYPHRTVLVEGYTDNTGSDALNQELSARRANAVKTALMDMDVEGERISTRGHGKAFPVASNSTASSRQLNRRVEIILSDENGNIAASR